MNKVFVSIFLLLALVSSSCTSDAELGKKPIDLTDLSLNIDVASFFKNEKYFSNAYDEPLRVEVEEPNTNSLSLQKPHLYNKYSIEENKKKVPVARFDDLEFQNLDLYSDPDDKKVRLLVVEKDSVSRAQLDHLTESINKKLGEYRLIRDDYSVMSYRWKKKGGETIEVKAMKDHYTPYREDEPYTGLFELVMVIRDQSLDTLE